MKAVLKNHRQSPRKVRSVASMLRGKSVDKAIIMLGFVPKAASLPIRKLLESAISNAKESGLETKNLSIKEIRVDEGITLKRARPRSRGMSNPIRKRSSHIQIILENK
jgi:large subunit ribosomal protein L22